MTKLTTSIFLCLIFFSCKTERKIKSYTLKEFSTKLELGDTVKDTIVNEYLIAFYPSGEQSLFVGLKDNDTMKFPDKKTTIKKDDNKGFIYDEKNKLLFVTVKKGDTTFTYNGDDLENPQSFIVTDKKNKIIADADMLLSTISFYRDTKYDKYSNLTYAVINEEYLPTKLDFLLYSDIEISQKKVEGKRTLIREINYEYY